MSRSRSVRNHDGIDENRARAFRERVERKKEEIAALQDDLKEIMIEVKHAGLDVKLFKQVIRISEMGVEEYDIQDEKLQAYREAMGVGARRPREESVY